MNYILSPDKNSYILKKYHTSSKMLIPLTVLSYLSYNTENNFAFNHLYPLSILNVGFHSYISISSIVTDYIKPNYLSRICRPINLTFHGLAIYGYFKNGYFKNIYKK